MDNVLFRIQYAIFELADGLKASDDRKSQPAVVADDPRSDISSYFSYLRIRDKLAELRLRSRRRTSDVGQQKKN